MQAAAQHMTTEQFAEIAYRYWPYICIYIIRVYTVHVWSEAFSRMHGLEQNTHLLGKDPG